MRKIVDKYEYENLVSKENKRLVEEFLTQKIAENRAPKTINQYRQDMRIILTYVYRYFDNKSLLDLSKKDIIRFLVMQKERGLSANRMKRLKSTLSSALGCFEDDDELDYNRNIAAKIKPIKGEVVREITFLTDAQVAWLKEQLLAKGKILMVVYLMLTYISGKRRGEIHQVMKDGLTERYHTNTVIGKGQRPYKIYYDQEVQDLIRMYLEERGPDVIPQLFVKVYKNGKKRAVHPATFNEWCVYMEKLLSAHEGRYIHINPHCFRHSRIDNLNRSGVPLEKISNYVNHKSLDITKSYLADRGEEDAADILGIDLGVTRIQEQKETYYPLTTQVPVMVDKTDRKQQIMTKQPKSKPKVEQLAWF
ncbi:MAG TPA: tyrosine-type recombinase/integrase [Bacillota bacterium]|nr:tyrosine-type recombinase/integrase [Bacillota bacterium]